MRSTIPGLSLAALAALVCLACGDSRGPALLGSWTGEDSLGGTLQLVFAEGGTALWIADRVPGVQDTTVLTYRADTSATPAHLDLRGFMSGRLAGMTLYGIYEVAGGDTLRVDFRPGMPGQSAVRPDSFSAETRVLRRTE